VKCIFALILVLIIFKHRKYRIQKIVLICVLGMVGGDRNLFVRKRGASQKNIGKHWCRSTTYLFFRFAPRIFCRKPKTDANDNFQSWAKTYVYVIGIVLT